MFQLKSQLNKNRDRLTGKTTPAPFLASYTGLLEGATGEDDANVQMEIDDINNDAEGDDCEGKGSGKSKVKARFGRQHTHNDELCVNCCGVIVGRTTCYGSEGIGGVRVRPQNSFTSY